MVTNNPSFNQNCQQRRIMLISKSSYTEMDKQILYEEYLRHKETISKYSSETPYYVYSLCRPTGEPFYVGKGKNTRAFDHLKNFIKNKIGNKRLQIEFDKLDGEPPIMFIVDGNLSEEVAFELEKSIILEHGRFFEGGELSNIMPGGGTCNLSMLSSIGGKLGGRTTKDNNLGIFSSDYDRSAQSKSNWTNGLMDHIDFASAGKIGGNLAVETQIGIHDPKYQDKKIEWAKLGAQANINGGNVSGIFYKEWIDNNKERAKEIRSKSGVNGGKVVGSMLWWNNGIINKRSIDQPIGFVKGQLMSEKKRQSVNKNFNINKEKELENE